MIAKYIGSIFHKAVRQRCVRALALWLPLLFALSSETAFARGHGASARLHYAESARPHRVRISAYMRRHGVSAAVSVRSSRVSKVYARTRHTYARHTHIYALHTHAHAAPSRWRIAAHASSRRGLIRFAASRPALRFQGAGSASSSVVADAMRFVGAGNVTGMRGPWCADYASMILRRTGHRPLAGRSVSAAFAYGPRVRQPKPGDLVVINTRAGYARHVGFFAGWDHGQMVMVSGNWGHRVSVAPISPSAVAAFIGV